MFFLFFIICAYCVEKEENIWAIEPEELRRLGDHLILIHPAGFERLRKTPFYKFNGGK